MDLTEIGKTPASAGEAAFLLEVYYRRNSNQAVEQVRRLRTPNGRILSQQVTEVFNPIRDDRLKDELLLGSPPASQQPDRALLAMLAQVANPRPDHPDRPPPRGFTQEESEFLAAAFGHRQH